MIALQQSNRSEPDGDFGRSTHSFRDVVIPKKQPVKLLLRSAYVRSMQHELVERYRQKSVSFGTEPLPRLRIYPV